MFSTKCLDTDSLELVSNDYTLQSYNINKTPDMLHWRRGIGIGPDCGTTQPTTAAALLEFPWLRPEQ